MALPRLLTATAGRIAQTAGRAYDYATPGSGTSTLTNAGRSITDPNQVYVGGSGYTGLLGGYGDGRSAFAQVPQGPQTLGASTTTNRSDPTPDDQADLNNGGYGTGGAGGGSGSTYDPADLAYLDSQEGLLKQMLGRSQTTLNQGLTNLNDSFNRETGKANQQRSRTMEDFQVKREDTIRGKDSSLDRVDTNARTLNDSLRRILGLASGSGSSAFKYAAPNAVARQASQQRTGVLGDYAENDRNIGLSERRATEDFSGLLEDLGMQRNQRESELRSGVLESEQDTNAKLGEIAGKRASLQGGGYAGALAAQRPFDQAIQERQSQLDGLFERFRTPTLTPKAVNVQAPTLRDYMVDRAAINANNQGGGQDEYSPYSYFLKRNPDQGL